MESFKNSDFMELGEKKSDVQLWLPCFELERGARISVAEQSKTGCMIHVRVHGTLDNYDRAGIEKKWTNSSPKIRSGGIRDSYL